MIIIETKHNVFGYSNPAFILHKASNTLEIEDQYIRNTFRLTDNDMEAFCAIVTKPRIVKYIKLEAEQ